jgi:hypothetical protein
MLAPILLVGGVAAALGVARPTLLVAGMFLGMLFDRAGVTGMKVDAFPITASKLAVLGSVGVWVLRVGVTRVAPVRWHPVLSAMLGMVIVSAISIAATGSMTNGKFVVFGLGMMLVMVGLVYAVLAEAELRGLYRFVALCLCAAVALSVARAGGSGEAARASGTMGDPNEWATVVLLLTGLSLGGLAGDPHRLAPLLRVAVLLAAPLAVLRSESRSALVAMLIVAPGWIWLLRGRQRELGVVGALAAVGGVALLDLEHSLRRFQAILDRIGGAPAAYDPSLEERSELFRQGVDLFRDNWFLGAGPGNFAKATGFVSLEGRLRPAHNTYLEMAGEQGVVGLMALGIFALTVAWTLREGLRTATTEERHARVLGVALGLGGVGLMAATLGLLTFAMAWLVLGFGLAVVEQAGREDAEGGQPEAGR